MKQFTVAMLFISLFTIGSAKAETLPTIKESQCVVLNETGWYNKTSVIENSQKNGLSAYNEMVDAINANPKDGQSFSDQFGIVRFYQSKVTKKYDIVYLDPQDKECSAYFTAHLVRLCSGGERQSKALCVTYCYQRRDAPDCR